MDIVRHNSIKCPLELILRTQKLNLLYNWIWNPLSWNQVQVSTTKNKQTHIALVLRHFRLFLTPISCAPLSCAECAWAVGPPGIGSLSWLHSVTVHSSHTLTNEKYKLIGLYKVPSVASILSRVLRNGYTILASGLQWVADPILFISLHIIHVRPHRKHRKRDLI